MDRTRGHYNYGKFNKSGAEKEVWKEVLQNLNLIQNLENIHLTKVKNKNGGVVWESL